MFKKLSCFALSAALVLGSAGTALAAQPAVRVLHHGYEEGYSLEYGTVAKETDAPVLLLFVNGDVVSDADAVIKNGSTLVPLRVVGNRLGASVVWNGADKSIVLEKNGINIHLQIGKDTITVNGEKSKLHSAPQLINSLTYVPLRAISEGFGAEVGYADDLLDHTKDIRAVYVQNKAEEPKLTEEQAVEKAEQVYFEQFLPTVQESVLLNHNKDITGTTPENAAEKLGKPYIGKCVKDLGQYYYIKFFENGSDYALIDKYDGTCHPVYSYSMVAYEIAAPDEVSGWAFSYQ